MNDSSTVPPFRFQVDMEGKRAEWEGIVKVPFVDEVRGGVGCGSRVEDGGTMGS